MSRMRQKCGFNRFVSRCVMGMEDRLEERMRSRARGQHTVSREIRMYGPIRVYAGPVPEWCQPQQRKRGTHHIITVRLRFSMLRSAARRLSDGA